MENILTKVYLEEILRVSAVLKPTISITSASPVILRSANKCLAEELREIVENAPAILLSLYEHHFYLQLLGDKDRTNSDMYFDNKDFEKVRDVLPSLFQQAVLSDVYHTNSQRGFCLVTVRGITQLGEAVVKSMQADGRAPKELKKLYCTPFCIDVQSKLGLYALSEGAAENEYVASPFINAVLEDKSIRGMDISCLSLQQCEQDGLLQFLVSKSATSYLYIDVYPKSQIRMKRFLWRAQGFNG